MSVEKEQASHTPTLMVAADTREGRMMPMSESASKFETNERPLAGPTKEDQ